MKRRVIIFGTLLAFSLAVPSFATDWLSGGTGNNIRDWAITDDSVWLGTDDCLVRWDKTELTYKVFTEESGLLRNRVTCIDADSKGVIWMGMYDVIQSFDGETFTTYQPDPALADYDEYAFIRSVHVAPDDKVWIGTCRGGVYCFDGVTWTHYTEDNSGLPLNCVSEIAFQSDGTVWFNLTGIETVPDMSIPAAGIASFDGETWTHYTPDNSGLSRNDVTDVFVDSKDRVWFTSYNHAESLASSDSYIDMFDGETWTRYVDKAKHVINIDEDSDGNIWFAQTTNVVLPGLVKFDGETWTDVDLKPLSDLSLLGFQDVSFDNDGIAWLIGYRGINITSLQRYDGSAIIDLTVDAPRISGIIQEVLVDNVNNVWIATDAGISKFTGGAWENIDFNLDGVEGIPNKLYTREQLDVMTNKVKALAVDRDGTVWVGSDYGIRSFNGSEWKLYDYNLDDIFFNHITSIVVDDNNVKWLANMNGLSSYDGERWVYPDLCSCSFQTNSAAIDHDGVMWFCQASNIWTFDGVTWTIYNQEDHDWNEILKNSNVVYPFRDGIEHTFDYSPLIGSQWAVTVDNDNVKWFCGNDGIWSYDGGSWTSYIEKGKEIAGETYYNQVYATDVIADGDNIKWFAIYGKLASFDGSEWAVYDQEMTGDVQKLAIDNNDVIWLVSAEGVGNLRSVAKAALMRGAVDVEEETVPAAFAVTGNYPNPFNPTTTIEFTLPEGGIVELSIYNVTGQRICDLTAGYYASGTHSAVWNGRDDNGTAVSSGIYFSCLKMRDRIATNRMMLVK